MILQFCVLLVCLTRFTIGDLVVTQFHVDEAEEALLFFRSLWAFNPQFACDYGTMSRDQCRIAHFNHYENHKGESSPTLLEAHACVHGTGSNNPVTNELRVKFAAVGATLHALSSAASSAAHFPRDSTEWRNVLCSVQVAESYHTLYQSQLQQHGSMKTRPMHMAAHPRVLFIGLHLLVMNDLKGSLLGALLQSDHQDNEEQTAVYCMPKLNPRSAGASGISGSDSRGYIVAAQYGGLCELDVFMIPSPRVGAEMFSNLNASMHIPGPVPAWQGFEMAARSVARGILFWMNSNGADWVPADGGAGATASVAREFSGGGGNRYVLRAGREWYWPVKRGDNSIPIQRREYDSLALGNGVVLVEFDGVEHALRIDRSACIVYIHVEWPQFNTVGAFTEIFKPIYEQSTVDAAVRGDVLAQLSGCADESLRFLPVQRSAIGDTTSPEANDELLMPLVYDTTILNDELHLLRLRLMYLKTHVDFHVVVESCRTFTGKIKPLHFYNSKHLFAEYAHRIIHIVLPHMLFETAESIESDVDGSHCGLSLDEIRRSGIIIPAEAAAVRPHVLDHAREVWLNEYFSRNGVAYGLEVEMARCASLVDSKQCSSSDRRSAQASDLVILADIDEIPHAKAIEVLRSRQLGASPGVHSRVYKLYPQNYMYDFGCYMGTSGNYDAPKDTVGNAIGLDSISNDVLRAGATAATTIGYAKTRFAELRHAEYSGKHKGLDEMELLGRNNWITLTRMHQQSTQPYPFENVIHPGTWHLSFFGGAERIKNKLKSYSHQNFVRQFIPSEQSQAQATPVYDPNTGLEIIPKSLPEGEISVELIQAKIASGMEIDNRNRRKCTRSETGSTVGDDSGALNDEETMKIRELWTSIVGDNESSATNGGDVSVIVQDRGDGPINYSIPGMKIAFVTGFIGSKPEYFLLPAHPRDRNTSETEWYFITNSEELFSHARDAGYYSILVNAPVVDSAASVENSILNSKMSKQLKIFPQKLLPREYDFIIWFDYRYDLRMPELMQTMANWTNQDWQAQPLVHPLSDADVRNARSNSSISYRLSHSPVAMMLHHRPKCCGADIELKEALLQPRYAMHKSEMEIYMEEEVAAGYLAHGERHLQTGFIIYNMHHPETSVVQNMWQEHMNRVGIMCQIAFYFVCQRFNSTNTIKEYKIPWNYGRKYLVVTNNYDEDEVGTTATSKRSGFSVKWLNKAQDNSDEMEHYEFKGSTSSDISSVGKAALRRKHDLALRNQYIHHAVQKELSCADGPCAMRRDYLDRVLDTRLSELRQQVIGDGSEGRRQTQVPPLPTDIFNKTTHPYVLLNIGGVIPMATWFNVNAQYVDKFYNYTSDAALDAEARAFDAQHAAKIAAKQDYVEGQRKYELSSGEHTDDGFLSRRYILRQADDLVGFPDASVDIVYSSHTLEHTSSASGETFRTLTEWHRVLKVTGILLIAVPDLEMLCRLMVNSTMPGSIQRKYYTTIINGGQVDRYDYHVSGFDERMLHFLLESAGFCRIERVSDFDLFDSSFGDASTTTFVHVPLSLNMVARPCRRTGSGSPSKSVEGEEVEDEMQLKTAPYVPTEDAELPYFDESTFLLQGKNVSQSIGLQPYDIE